MRKYTGPSAEMLANEEARRREQAHYIATQAEVIRNSDAAMARRPAGYIGLSQTQRAEEMAKFISWLDYRYGYKLGTEGMYAEYEGLQEEILTSETLREFAAEFIAAGTPAKCNACSGTRYVMGQVGLMPCPACKS